MSENVSEDLIYPYSYYEKQLLIKSFSYLIVWFHAERNAAIASQNKAYVFSCFVKMKKVFKCLNKLINKTSHEMYCNQLAISMNELLLLRKGLQSISNYVHVSDHNLNYNSITINIAMKYCRRLFHKLHYRACSKLIYRRKLFKKFSNIIRDNLDHWVAFTISMYNNHAKVIKIISIYIKSLKKSSIRKLHQNCLKYKSIYVNFIKSFNFATRKRFLITFHKLRMIRIIRRTNYFKLQYYDRYYLQQSCQKRYFHILYRHVRHCRQRREDSQYIKWDVYFKYTSLRRAMVLLLRNLKYKLYKKQQTSECKLILHRMMIWKFRRQSNAMVTWQCLFQRNKIDMRRVNIAKFHFRQKFLNCYWDIYMKYLIVSKTMKCNYRKGEFLSDFKKASYCMFKIKQHYIKSRNQMILSLRGILFWKLWRSLLALKRFRSYCNVRKYKRNSLLQAKAAYQLQEKKRACVEFIKVTLCNNNTSNSSSNNLLKRTFKSWKSLMSKRRLLNNQNMLLEKSEFCFLQNKQNIYFNDKQDLSTKHIKHNQNSSISTYTNNVIAKNDFHYSILSREKPRSLSSILTDSRHDNISYLSNSNVAIDTSNEGIICTHRELNNNPIKQHNNSFINNRYDPTKFIREPPRLPIKNNYQVTLDGKISTEVVDKTLKSSFFTTSISPVSSPSSTNDINTNILQSIEIIDQVQVPQSKQSIVKDILNFIEEFKHLLINN